MPKREDIKSVLIIGAGPIVIGQACEFDYSGTQACRAFTQEGFRTILVNSNPATIMTDPELADATYIEPLTGEVLTKIIQQERPDAILPTMGGQTALNLALELSDTGVLDQYGVKMIGANQHAIRCAEDRKLFQQAMQDIGLNVPCSQVVSSVEEARIAQEEIGYPIIIRPSFTLGGSGGGIAYNRDEFFPLCEYGLRTSPRHEVLLERSLLGWQEFETEVVRDNQDNVIIVCVIENIDPMGVHTGDSITVAPAQTLTDREYQLMRDASIAILRKIGVETGGSNVQFAIDPDTGEMMVIEMNPRVSRSSALASKATGFPIAKVAAKLAMGYALDELKNEITGGAIPISFEPSLDYVVTKIPRFDFEKFPKANDRLGTQMKSVGEVMAIGRSFQESFQKALRSLEIDIAGLDPILDGEKDNLVYELKNVGPHRIRYVADAFRMGLSVEDVHQHTKIAPWFLAEIADLITEEIRIKQEGFAAINQSGRLRTLKQKGFSDTRLAVLVGKTEQEIRDLRLSRAITPVYKRVDSCAAEFPVSTAYLYSSYDEECEADPTKKKKIIVLGGGPNRIGQGIEFDYCCVHALAALQDAGYETIMVNCNPETVSTDYDISDRLYFEPLTLEDVLSVCRIEQPEGIIVQFGGQTPLKLAEGLSSAGFPIIGTSPDSIDLAEDRARFQKMLQELSIKQPNNHFANNVKEACFFAEQLGYPIIIRPSHVLGGRAMEVVHDEVELVSYMERIVKLPGTLPILLDSFLKNAVEVDVDAVSDGETTLIGGIMQHIEQAGIHSGDSACSLPPYALSDKIKHAIEEQVMRLSKALRVVGLMNVQFAIQEEDIFVLEVNPRASRTVPFVSKTIGISLARIAACAMFGKSLAEQGYQSLPTVKHYFAVKEAVFPFNKFVNVDPILGPEMRSTGEVMGIADSFGEAFFKAQLSTGVPIPLSGLVFISVRDEDKENVLDIARDFSRLGFLLCATMGTAMALKEAGVACRSVNKVHEGHPHVVDMLKNEEIALIVNVSEGRRAVNDSSHIRRTAINNEVFYMTTLAAARAAIMGLKKPKISWVKTLQQLHAMETS